MKKTNHTIFPQLIGERISAYAKRAAEKMWVLLEEPQFSIQIGAAESETPETLRYRPLRQGEIYAEWGWGGLWGYLTLPKALDEDPRYLFLRIQGECTIYHRGVAYAGIDTAHPYARIPEDASELYVWCGTYQTGLWMREGETQFPFPIGRSLVYGGASLVKKDPLYWEFYHRLSFLDDQVTTLLAEYGIRNKTNEYHTTLHRIPPGLRRLLQTAAKALDIYDRCGASEALKALRSTAASFQGDFFSGRIAAVGNSHLDLVWLWPRSITHKKNIHTASTLVRLLETYPKMRFTFSQPYLIEQLKDESPALYCQMRHFIENGRLELTGGMYVESDTLLPCGEALARSFVLGQQFFLKETGTYSTILWLPDVFGYSQSIPQIAVAAGCRYFFTTKLSWSALHRFPYTSFIWSSPDGSQLIAHLSQVGYESRANCGELLQCSYTNQQAGIWDTSLLTYGFGDGGGGVTEEQCERIALAESAPGIPVTYPSRADDFFRELSIYADDLPVYKGELYLEYHRGCYTTARTMKSAYRSVEKGLQTLEAAACAAGTRYDTAAFWKRLVFMQFHDALPGSSISEVYKELIPELLSTAEELAHEAETLLEGEGQFLSCFNPHAVDTIHPISLSQEELGKIQKRDGGVPWQLLSDGSSISLLHLEALEGKRIILDSKPLDSALLGRALQTDPYSVALDQVRVEFSRESGMLAALEIEGIPLLVREGFFSLHADRPSDFEAWEIDYHSSWGERVDASGSLTVTESGPLMVQITSSISIGAESSMDVRYTLYKDLPYLFISLDIDWRERYSLLTYTIPTGYKGRWARFGTPFGSIDRSAQSGSTEHEAHWEDPASRWAAITDGMGRGLAVISESTYGWRISDGDLRLSLIRSVHSSDDKNPGVSTDFPDIGRHTIRFAIGTYQGRCSDGRPNSAQAADLLYTPALTYTGDGIASFLHWIDTGSLAVGWIKECEEANGIIIRCHECAGAEGVAKLSFSLPYGLAEFVDLLERPQSELAIVRNQVSIPYKPYQLISLRLSFL
ncbi:alpha-mannosidase [Sediminispirochaeta smaragdinae]|uniref:Alpha-mannosidase n=1 Tax=Sediminispirochaeta smaragdinae (strain DSM 11293 / JCM 15392 / SEBR 4228) TaxID=573413 RepID=E1R2S7_SEDSS|nr:alpha-mannosidase [Sediminispirochaeta smaragdinae]ADK80359.1 Alpha-mannosidase [Sediminispirochaeta smaragdinae DSM 11293]